MRAAITIIHNGLHHLKHNGFAEFMLEHFDVWVVVEGHARPGGSTYWCRKVNVPYKSDDGTIEFLQSIQSDKLLFYSHHKYYQSKDEQFNKAIQLLKTRTNHAYLWQVDCDEQWNPDYFPLVERRMWRSHSNVGAFQFNHFIKDDLIALGWWGSGWVNRVWRWRGEPFTSHEPATMKGQTKTAELFPYKFDHYSMKFEQDVKFKSKYYRGHEQVYQNWKRLDELEYPCHISNLFGSNCQIGRTDSYLYKINDPCVNVTNLADLKNNEC